MSKEWHGGKGSDRRKNSNQNKFNKGYDNIDWSKKRTPDNDEKVVISRHKKNEAMPYIEKFISL